LKILLRLCLVIGRNLPKHPFDRETKRSSERNQPFAQSSFPEREREREREIFIRFYSPIAYTYTHASVEQMAVETRAVVTMRPASFLSRFFSGEEASDRSRDCWMYFYKNGTFLSMSVGNCDRADLAVGRSSRRSRNGVVNDV